MYFVFSDAHGSRDAAEEMIKQWNPEKETLVYLGDMMDRGPDAYGVLKLFYDLKRQHGDRVIVLKGNHDEDFAYWAYSGEDASFLMTEDIKTSVKSFYHKNPEKYGKDSKTQKAGYIRRNFKEELSFLNRLPLHHETEHCIFVHAGIDIRDGDWKNGGPTTYLWIRKDFHYEKQEMPKRVFFGHTVTSFLGKKDYDVWIGPLGDRVGVDGGFVFGGQLNGLRLNEKGIILEKIAIKRGENGALLTTKKKGEI